MLGSLNFVGAQNLKNVPIEKLNGIVMLYNQPACKKCFQEIYQYYQKSRSQIPFLVVSIAPYNSVFRRTDLKGIQELVPVEQNNIWFTEDLTIFSGPPVEPLHFPHLLFVKNGHVIKQLSYAEIYQNDHFNADILHRWIRN